MTYLNSAAFFQRPVLRLPQMWQSFVQTFARSGSADTAAPTLQTEPSGMSTAAPPASMRSHGRGSALLWLAMATLGLLMLAGMAMAAGTGGVALQAAYTAVDDMVNGYGKQLLTVMGFAVAAIGYMAANSTGVVMKFIGFAVFLSVGLAAAVGLVGALV